MSGDTGIGRETHAGCEKRGGICDCAGRPCGLDLKEKLGDPDRNPLHAQHFVAQMHPRDDEHRWVPMQEGWQGELAESRGETYADWLESADGRSAERVYREASQVDEWQVDRDVALSLNAHHGPIHGHRRPQWLWRAWRRLCDRFSWRNVWGGEQ